MVARGYSKPEVLEGSTTQTQTNVVVVVVVAVFCLGALGQFFCDLFGMGISDPLKG